MKSVFASLLNELHEGRDCELVTILTVKGTAPRESGCTMLVGGGGIPLAGTVGGGCIEWQALKRAACFLEKRASGEEVFEHGCRTEAEGSSCGAVITLRFTYCASENEALKRALLTAASAESGTLRLPGSGDATFVPEELSNGLFENDTLSLFLPPPDRVLLFGAGHVAQALVPLLSRLGFTVTVYDERKDLADREHFPDAHEVLTGSFSDDLVWRTGAETRDCILIMSATHLSDETVLSHFVDKEYRYIGMLGSRKKAAAIREKFIKKGVPTARLDTIHIPIGLPIGARTPIEVALSIAAELVKNRAEGRTITD